MLAIRHRIASYIFCAVVALAPLPFGSVDQASIALWVLLLGLVVVLSIPTRVSASQLNFLLPAMAVALVWGLVLHEQISNQPWLAQDIVDPVWRQTARLLDMPLPQYVTVVRNQPLFAAGAQVAAFLSLLSGFLLGSDRAFANALLRTFAWSGAIYAVYAIVSFAWDPTMVLWRSKIAYTRVLTGTFINRNTAATYFGACAIVWLLMYLKRLFGPTLRIPAETPLSSLVLRNKSRRAMISFGIFILLLSTTLMTGSRAGSLLLLMACLVICLLSLRREADGGKATLGLIAGLIAAVAILLKTAGSGVDARVGAEGLVDAARLSVYRATLQLILDHPWLGSGLGTFAWIFPSYRPDEISAWGVWDRAHSVPLEIAAEQGVPFTLVVVFAYVMVVLLLIKGLKTRVSGKIYPAAGLLIALLSTTHSLVDFSLQIPGFAIVAFAVVGIGAAQSVAVRNTTAAGAVHASRDAGT